MKSFAEALCSNEKNDRIPETYDYFGGLIGEWAIEWNDRLNDAVPLAPKTNVLINERGQQMKIE